MPADIQTRTPARRRSTLDQETVQTLERRLSNRPEKDELVDRNILKDDNVAPALQAAKEKLQRSQLEDKLSHALQQRPKPEELMDKGIISKGLLSSSVRGFKVLTR
ncbi:hypothetical protein BV22DRAFT_1017439 [Leucogyrophana mollusca]|uniref:Uncharacterized protein n=1 Tax=Leucogyrophana mollusca TaxID=85980 RepID=A0ACB8B9L9_9AGAM|nr:hypothetical protein BV22DRAFT_1017439 [Leucogyrophana mollusca]